MKNKLNLNFIKNKTELAKAKAANLQGVRKTPSELDPSGPVIMGSGPLNRDGVPSLPPEQRSVNNWPVLDLGIHPEISREEWSLKITGAVSETRVLRFKDLLQLPVIEDVSDFHCVTGWSQLGMKWRGVRFSEIAKISKVKEEANFVYLTASDGYSTNVTLEEAMKYDVLLVFEWNGSPLPKEHGGPVRMITPQLWAWKGAKWISGIEFLAMDRRGFWENKGYSNSAIPWLNDRYTADEQN